MSKKIASVTFDKAIPIILSRFQQRFSIGWELEELAPGRVRMRGVPDDVPCGCVPLGDLCEKHAVEVVVHGIGYLLTFQPEPAATPEPKTETRAKKAPAATPAVKSPPPDDFA